MGYPDNVFFLYSIAGAFSHVIGIRNHSPTLTARPHTTSSRIPQSELHSGPRPLNFKNNRFFLMDAHFHSTGPSFEYM